jgi:hypothetical protein
MEGGRLICAALPSLEKRWKVVCGTWTLQCKVIDGSAGISAEKSSGKIQREHEIATH